MQVILLSGGSGKRLWPLSNEVRSKQFIKIFKTEEGHYESMVQRVFRQLKSVDPKVKVTIATSETQLSAIHNQLGTQVDVSIEPCRRDTFPAIALAAAYLHDVTGVHEDEPIVVCPVDPYVEEDYFRALKDLSALVEQGVANLLLMGMKPTYPSEKYGYIIPTDTKAVSPVLTFKEKPTEKVAKAYIAQGALWNGGVFACKLGYILSRAHELMDFDNHATLLAKYDTLEKISFDYAVVEHEKDIAVVRFNGLWKDIGTWNTFTEVMTEQAMGHVVTDGQCTNVHVINELDVPVLCMGLRDTIVTASSDGIIVSDKNRADSIKPYVDSIDQQVRYAEKSWGSFRVMDVQNESLTIKVMLAADHAMNYHSHARRTEIWTVLEGTGVAVMDGKAQRLQVGDVVKVPIGCKHKVKAITNLTMIEVQLGKDISVEDKTIWPDTQA